MSLRLLGFTDGRLRYANRAIDKLLDLGLSDAEVLQLLRYRRAGAENTRAARLRSQEKDGEIRRCVAQWAIRRLLSLGFSESEIAGHAAIAPSTVTHALTTGSTRAIGSEVVTRLKAAVQSAGVERLSVLLQGVEVRVLDTCNAKGCTVDDAMREHLSGGARALLQRALLLCSAPVAIVSGIHAFLVQVGDRCNGLYLLWAPLQGSATRQNRIEQLKRFEHELGHVTSRFRDERIRLERETSASTTSGVGRIA